MAETWEHPSERRRSRRRASWRTTRTFFGVVLMSYASSTSSLEASSQTDDGMFTKQDCARYNDDTVFTSSVCGQTDKAICFKGTEVVETPCNSTYWCRELCGTMCAEEAGALCFYERLSHLEHTCGLVSEILLRLGRDPGANSTARLGTKTRTRRQLAAAAPDADTAQAARAAPQPRRLRAGAEAEEEMGHGLDYNETDYGCGHHAYCEFCNGDCNSDSMGSYVHSKYGHRIITALSAEAALVDASQTCYHFGYLSTNAAAIVEKDTIGTHKKAHRDADAAADAAFASTDGDGDGAGATADGAAATADDAAPQAPERLSLVAEGDDFASAADAATSNAGGGGGGYPDLTPDDEEQEQRESHKEQRAGEKSRVESGGVVGRVLSFALVGDGAVFMALGALVLIALCACGLHSTKHRTAQYERLREEESAETATQARRPPRPVTALPAKDGGDGGDDVVVEARYG